MTGARRRSGPSADESEGGAEVRLEGLGLALFLDFTNGLFGRGTGAAQVLESGENVAVERVIGWADFGRGDRFASGVDGRQLIFQFEDDALGRFLTYAWDADQGGDIGRANGRYESEGGQAGENGDGEFGADAADRDEAFEEGFLFSGGKAEEDDGVLAYMRVDAETGDGPGIGKCSESGDGDLNFVADAGGFENEEVGMLLEYGAFQVTDHGLEPLDQSLARAIAGR